MIVSTKGRYALRVMIDLAENQSEKYIPLKAIAARQGISEKYLEKHPQDPGPARAAAGAAGQRGRLPPDPAPPPTTAFSDILLLTEGSLAPVACLEPGAAGCARLSECRTYQLWRGLDEVIRAYLDQITLADLARPAQSGDHYMI